MKIIFMGTPDFAVPSLRALAGAKKHEVALVVTQPDRPKGRSKSLQPSDVKCCALELGIPVYQPERVRTPDAIARLREENADIIVVAAFGQILPKELLEMPRYGCINLHGSLLPEYRGASPIQQAVIDGKKEAGNTVMQMAEGLDSGDILLQERVTLAEDETAGSLYARLSGMGGPLLLRALDEIEAGTITPVPQDASKATHVKMLRKEMGDLDWAQPAQRLECQVRGFNPWPAAYTHWNGKLLKIWMAKAVPETDCTAAGGADAARKVSAAEAAAGKTKAVGGGDVPFISDPGEDAALSERQARTLPGTVIEAQGDRLLVQTGDGVLALTEVQLEGKKRLPVRDFLLGCRIRPGDVLTGA